MEKEVSIGEVNTSSCSSEEDIQPEIKEQFLKLAETLQVTNQNLHTFEFMLSQYRQMARIAPFSQAQTEECRSQETESKSTTSLGTFHPDIFSQLKVLSNAVESLKTQQQIDLSKMNQDSSTSELFSELKQLRQQVDDFRHDHESQSLLKSKVLCLETSLNEKNLLCEKLSESNQRLARQLTEEKERSLQLDKKLDAEKKAAAQVGRDIEKYVKAMSELETKARSSQSRIAQLEQEISEAKRQSESLSAENEKLKQKMSRPENTEERFVERIRDLETRLAVESQAKENLQTTVEILRDQLSESRQLGAGLNDSSCSSSRLCSSCLDNDRLEENAQKLLQTAQEIHRQTEKDLKKVFVDNSRLESKIRALETRLGEEESMRIALTSQLEASKQELRYRGKENPIENSEEKINHLELPQGKQPSKEKKERRKLEKEVLEIRLKLAEALADKDAALSTESRLLSDVRDAKDKLSNVEDDLSRLRSKSQLLLSRYREKRQIVSDLRGRMENVRNCLFELRTLCRTKEENFRDILDHLGCQIQICSRLVAARLGLSYSFEEINLSKNIKLATWFVAIQALSSWTHKQLMAIGSHASSPTSVDGETFSEISHLIQLEGEKEKSLRMLVDAQDKISSTQNESFSLLFSRTKQE